MISSDRTERVTIERLGFFKDFFVQGESDFRSGAFNNVLNSAFFGKVEVIFVPVFEHLNQLFTSHEVVNNNDILAEFLYFEL